MLWMQRNRKITKGKDTIFYVRGRRVEASKLARYARRKKAPKDLEVLQNKNSTSSYQWCYICLIYRAAIPSDIRCYTPAPRIPPTPKAPTDEQANDNSLPSNSELENQSPNAERSQSSAPVLLSTKSAISLQEPCHTYPHVPLDLPAAKSAIMAKAPNRFNIPTQHKRNGPALPKSPVLHTRDLEHSPLTVSNLIEEGKILPKATVEPVSGTSGSGFGYQDLHWNTTVDSEKSDHTVSSIEEHDHCHDALFHEMLHAQKPSIGDSYHSTYRDILLSQTLSTARHRHLARRSASPSFANPTKAFTSNSPFSSQEEPHSPEGFVESIDPSHLTVDLRDTEGATKSLPKDTPKNTTTDRNEENQSPGSHHRPNQAPRSEHQAYTMQYSEGDGTPAQSNRHLALMESAVEARITKLKGQTTTSLFFTAMGL